MIYALAIYCKDSMNTYQDYSILYECYCGDGLNRVYPVKIVDTSDQDIKRFFDGFGFIEFKYIWDGKGYHIREIMHCKNCRKYNIP